MERDTHPRRLIVTGTHTFDPRDVMTFRVIPHDVMTYGWLLCALTM